MKKSLLILAVVSISFVLSAQTGGTKAYGLKDIENVQLKDRTRFTTNPDGILSSDAVYRIDTTLFSLKESGKAQVAVIAVNSIGNADPHDFLVRLMHQWGVGGRESDSGLGIILVIDQGAIEIATGYGTEGDLPDAMAKRVINNYMLPAFRQGDWDKGMLEGVAVISAILDGRPPEDVGRGTDDSFPLIMIAFFFGIPVIAVIIVLIFFAGRCPRCHKHQLRRTGTRIVDTGKGHKEEVTTYTCKNCGYIKTVRRNIGGGPGALGGVVIGSMLGGRGGFGGGHGGGFGGGGSWGGGGFGGGGAGGRF